MRCPVHAPAGLVQEAAVAAAAVHEPERGRHRPGEHGRRASRGPSEHGVKGGLHGEVQVQLVVVLGHRVRGAHGRGRAGRGGVGVLRPAAGAAEDQQRRHGVAGHGGVRLRRQPWPERQEDRA